MQTPVVVTSSAVFVLQEDASISAVLLTGDNSTDINLKANGSLIAVVSGTSGTPANSIAVFLSTLKIALKKGSTISITGGTATCYFS